MPFSITHVDGQLQIAFRQDGRNPNAEGVTLTPIWLRERSQDPSQLDATSGQRLFDPHLLDPDLSITEATVDPDGGLRVRFSDGHADRFDEALVAGFAGVAGAVGADGLPEPTPWSAATMATLPEHAWADITNDEGALLKALADFLRYGVIVVSGSPTNELTVVDVAERFGYIRETNFGRIFDVRVVPVANDLAYTANALGPHTDNPYRVPVPGIQLLHCLVNDSSGGDSTLVDSLAVVDQLRGENEEWFAVLASTVVQFRFRDASTDLRSKRTVIDTDAAGRVTGLNYSPKLDYPPLMSPERTQLYQSARRRMAELLRDPAFEVRFRLRPGDVEMFANDRVLHGRSAYDSTVGSRHLQGCYIDADGPRSLYRVLAGRGQNGV